MLTLISSTATEQSDAFAETDRHGDEDNIDWLERQLSELPSPPGKPDRDPVPSHGLTHVVLLGGRGSTAFRLRLAQSHLRHDLVPSHWSHAVLLGPLDDTIANTPIFEISLEPTTGFAHTTETNGLQTNTLGAYRPQSNFPNVAVMRLDVPVADWLETPTAEARISVLDHYQRQRAILDAPSLILSWLSFVWGVAKAGNPLLDGVGIPTAAMIEVVLNSVGYDLSPGVDSRASCPEAFYQAAKWWHLYYADKQFAPITGRYAVSHTIEP